jgi:hypothetical protein
MTKFALRISMVTLAGLFSSNAFSNPIHWVECQSIPGLEQERPGEQLNLYAKVNKVSENKYRIESFKIGGNMGILYSVENGFDQSKNSVEIAASQGSSSKGKPKINQLNFNYTYPGAKQIAFTFNADKGGETDGVVDHNGAVVTVGSYSENRHGICTTHHDAEIF